MPVADEGRGRVSSPGGGFTSTIRHHHHHLRPVTSSSARLQHFTCRSTEDERHRGNRLRSECDQRDCSPAGLSLRDDYHHGDRTHTGRQWYRDPEEPGGYLVPSDPSSSRSQLSEQSGELSDGPTHLFTLLSTGKQADAAVTMVTEPTVAERGAGPSHLVTCLWKSVSCLWVTVMAPPDVSLGKPLRACSNQRQNI